MSTTTNPPTLIDTSSSGGSPLLNKVKLAIDKKPLKTPIDEQQPPPKLKQEEDKVYSERISTTVRKAMGFNALEYLREQLQAVIDREAGEAASLKNTRERQTHAYEVHPGGHRKHRSKSDLVIIIGLAVLILVLFGGTITTMGGVFEKGGLGANLLLASLAAIPFAAGLMIPKVLGAIALSRDTKHAVLLWLTGLAALMFLVTIGLYPFAFADAMTSSAGGAFDGGGVFGDLSGETVEESAPSEGFKIAFIASLILLDMLLGGVLALFGECKIKDRRHRDVETPAEGAFLIEQEDDRNTNGERFAVAKADVIQALSEIEAEADRVAGVCLVHELKRAKEAAARAAAAELGLTLRDLDGERHTSPLFDSTDTTFPTRSF